MLYKHANALERHLAAAQKHQRLRSEIQVHTLSDVQLSTLQGHGKEATIYLQVCRESNISSRTLSTLQEVGGRGVNA
jgi:hypothetical protein